MELPIIIGFLSGILYAEVIKLLGWKRALLTFPFRLGLMALLFFYGFKLWGKEGLVALFVSHLAGRTLHLLYRAFFKG